MGKQGTLHPRKHPGSSAGVVPEHRHKQTDSNTHRQIQTHTETHTPNGCFPSPQAPTSHPATPLNPCGSHPWPAFTQTRTEAAAPYPPRPIEGMSSRMPGLVPDHTIIPGEGSHEELGGSLPPRRLEKKQGLFQQLRGRGEVGRGGDLKELASPGRTWIRLARIPRIPSAPSPPPPQRASVARQAGRGCLLD